MTYNAFESSIEQGRPIELYEIRVGSDAWNLTTADRQLTVDSAVYTPLNGLSRTPVAVGPEDRNEVVEFTLPSSHPFVRRYIDIVPGQRASMTIRRFHNNDPDEETATVFKGLVRSVGFILDGTEAKIAVLPISGALSRKVPRYTFKSLCNHVLYDQRCKVASAGFQVTGDVTGINASGNQLTINGLGAQPDGWADAGFVAFGSVDFRLVLTQVSDTVTLLLPFPMDLLGSSVDVFAGCDHSLATCKSKFDNVINHGGHAFVPLRNIFSTGIK